MTRNIIYILIFILIFLGIEKSGIPVNSQGISTLLIGIMLLTSFLFAQIIKRIYLPRITGYMFMGLLLGVSGIGFLTEARMDNLQFLENLALAFIALTAGGELRFKVLKKNLRAIISILSSQVIVIFIGMAIIFIVFAQFFEILANYPVKVILAFALLFAGTALSTSPATAIGIMTETKSRGKITDLILFITVLKAIVLIIVFPVVIIYSGTLISGSSLNKTGQFLDFMIQFGSSILTGIIFGAIIIWYLKKVGVEISIFLLAVTLAISEIGSLVGLDILLTSIITGIVVQNFSSKGKDLITGIEVFSLPIYVIFFCFAGASLHLELLGEALLLTLFLVGIRFVLNFAGNYIGASLAGESRIVKHYSWLGYIGQAGIALGLGLIIENTLPAEYGGFFLTVLISTVVINEMIGPVLLKWIFEKANETGADSK